MALKGTNQEFGRPYNRRIVLEAIRRLGPVAKAEIATRVGLTVQTVSNITRELEEQGFVTSQRQGATGRGYPARHHSINPDGAFAIGINISPQRLQSAATNLSGDIVATLELPMRKPEPAETIDILLRMAHELRQKVGGKRVLGIGLTMPGPFGVESMSFVGPTTLEGWKDVPVQDQLAQGTGLPVFVETDHAAAALGEQLYGAGRNLRDFYHLYVGVGLGGCMIMDGQTLRGVHRNAGEIGHLPLEPGGLSCPCGNQGCLERYLSLEAYERRVAEVGHEQWIRETTPLFRKAIISIENLFDPEAVIVGGLAPRALLEELVTAAEPIGNSIAVRPDRTAPRVIITESGATAVLRGAAAVALSGVLSPRHGLMFAENPDQPDADPMFRQGEAA